MANGKQAMVQLDSEAIMAIQKDLALFSHAAESLRKKLSLLIPAPYGSDTWWEQSIERSKKDIAEGRYTELKTKDDVKRFFDSL